MASAQPNPPLKVVLIDDSWLIRQSLGAFLGELEGVEVVGEADDEGSAIDVLRRQRPDLAIVDLQLKAGSGIGVLRTLSRDPENFGRPRAIVFSHHGQAVVRERCFALGIEEFFDKSTQMDELLSYIRRTIST